MDRVLVGTRKGLFTLDRAATGTGGWSIARSNFVGDPVTAVFGEPGNARLHAALDHGHFGIKVHRSTDAGETWREVPSPTFPPQPEGTEDRDPMRGDPIPWTVMRIWTIEGAHAAQPSTLWCGTLPGGLFRSRDGGDTWDLVRALWEMPARKKWFGGGADFPGIHTIIVDPRDPSRITVGVSCGGVWVSADGGESWACKAHGMHAEYMPPEQAADPEIQDPHRLAACTAHPDVIWSQHHNGIFRSTNGGDLWQEVKCANPSSFGFAVAAHPTDPDTAWFVPAARDEQRIPVDGRLVVTRTRDGGRSFQVLGHGLPERGAYDIVYRHALAVDDTGERLAMGSTTGSLWVSDDMGEQWICLSNHLPPIYCVRFV